MSNTKRTSPVHIVGRKFVPTEPTIQDVLDEVETIKSKVGSVLTELDRINLAIEKLQDAVSELGGE
jgi:regulator of replication initiation timing